jgi:hypothetical protein
MKRYPIYFYACWIAYLSACLLGLQWAISYQELVTRDMVGNFSTWRPAIGIAILFVAATLNFTFMALQVQSRPKA